MIGLSVGKVPSDKMRAQALRPSDPRDGSIVIDGRYQTSDFAIDTSFRDTANLVNEYREMSGDPDVDMAVDDIVNAAVTSEQNVQPVVIDFSRVELSDSIKEKVNQEFKYILQKLGFDTYAYDLFKSWYVDGRQYFQVMRKKDGSIEDVLQLDSRTIQRVKLVERKPQNADGKMYEEVVLIDEYYAYNPYWAPDITNNGGFGFSTTQLYNATVKIDLSDVVYVHSGQKDPVTGAITSFLEKSKKPLNNLKMMRDAQVILRVTRSVEKRVFQVDVGDLPKKLAEEHVKKQIQIHKNKMSYDPRTGRINGQSYQSSMLEDFWFPVRSGGRGSSVSNLESSNNLSNIDDIIYFQKLLYRSLNVPEGRLENAPQMIFGSRNDAMTRDEWKFNKFIDRIRVRYSSVFKDLLKIQLVSKKIVTNAEWEKYFDDSLTFTFNSDTYITKQQKIESLMAKIGNMGAVSEIVNKYVSIEWVYENILEFTEEEIKVEAQRIAKYKAANLSEEGQEE